MSFIFLELKQLVGVRQVIDPAKFSELVSGINYFVANRVARFASFHSQDVKEGEVLFNLHPKVRECEVCIAKVWHYVGRVCVRIFKLSEFSGFCNAAKIIFWSKCMQTYCKWR